MTKKSRLSANHGKAAFNREEGVSFYFGATVEYEIQPYLVWYFSFTFT